MPSNRSLRLMNAAHRFMLRISGGRLGWRGNGMPMLELTTTGRKSGERRSTMLSSPMQVGESYIVVASRGGDDTHPAWFLNLVADPHVAVTVRDEAAKPYIARVATERERAALWPRVAAEHPNYAGYQKRTQREIPLVFLDPA